MSKLFKITYQGKVSHIYGTCHITDATNAVCTLSAEAKQAFEQASCVVLEVTSEESEKLVGSMDSQLEDWKRQNKIGPQDPFTDYLSINQIKKIADLFVDELVLVHPSHLALFQLIETSPIFLCHKIQMKQLKSMGFLRGSSLDAQFEQQAKSVQKPTAFLDTFEDLAQRLIGCAFSYKEQVEYARQFFAHQFLLNQEETKKFLLQTITLYLAGDIEGLKQLFDSSNDSPITKLYKTQCMVYERDKIFVKAMMQHLQAGEAFFAMGAMHIPGVLALLKEYGCIVEPIQEGERLHAINTLTNTNVSLRKSTLLAHYRFSIQREETAHFFNSYNNVFLLYKHDLSLFLELIREGAIDRNHKVQMVNADQYTHEELLIISAILREPNAPKSIELNLKNNASDENIVVIAERLKSDYTLEDLTIKFGYISERGLQYLIEALKTKSFAGKLHLTMSNREWDSPLYPELMALINSKSGILTH